MKSIRRLATRGVLVPFALFALVLASSLPASAQTLADDSSASWSVDITIPGIFSMKW